VKALQIERLGSPDEFHFSLLGVLDAEGSRSLDRLLLKCQGLSARRVRLDLTGVESISSLGISVLTRWGRVYEETDPRIEMCAGASEIRRYSGRDRLREERTGEAGIRRAAGLSLRRRPRRRPKREAWKRLGPRLRSGPRWHRFSRS
jgi:hypothetical protein